MKKSIVLIIGLLLVIPLVFATPEDELLNLINQERQKHDLQPLRPLQSLTTSAVLHTEDMLKNGYLEHLSSDNKTSRQRIRSKGFTGEFTGENIGAHSGLINATLIFDLWINSSKHYQTILNPNYEYVGLGIKQGQYSHFDTFSTVYTADFGGNKRINNENNLIGLLKRIFGF